MLDNHERAKISEDAQERENEGGINEVAPVRVAKLGADQFSQGRREIAPSIRIGNRIERQGESLPGRPGEKRYYPAPIEEPPGSCFAG